MIRRTCKVLHFSCAALLSFTHTHNQHTHTHTKRYEAHTPAFPLSPPPCSSGSSSPLFYPVLTVTSVNGFTRLVNVVRLKLYCVLSLFCSITAELRSKLSLLCILLLLLFPQHPPSSPPHSMSAFTCMRKRHFSGKKKTEQSCWMRAVYHNVFHYDLILFFSVCHFLSKLPPIPPSTK